MASFESIQQRESGLIRALTGSQISMIALGGAIGTGLFLGSRQAIGLAGHSVIISYLIGAAIALCIMAALAEMTVAHPTSGSFGSYAEHYIHPLAGFTVKYMYWSCLVLAIGTEVTAIGQYMLFWFPGVPSIVWILLFSAVLIFVNTRNVHSFGTLEYWLSAIKVFAIVAFILLAAGILLWPGNGVSATAEWLSPVNFQPTGWRGTWVAVIVAIFSYLSIEMIAVAAGEAENPAESVKKAFRVTLFRLITFYILTLTLITLLVPTDQILAGGSPFVTVMQVVGIPFADSVLNFVIIVAALSAMNSQLYTSTRMMFSLARGGQAPSLFGRLRANGAPVNALLLCTMGIAVAAVVYVAIPENAFMFMISISTFGAMFTWFMIFLTHLAFRRRTLREGTALEYRIRGSRVGSAIGALLMLALMITTIFTQDFRPTLIYGIPALIATVIIYFLIRKPHEVEPTSSN